MYFTNQIQFIVKQLLTFKKLCGVYIKNFVVNFHYFIILLLFITVIFFSEF